MNILLRTQINKKNRWNISFISGAIIILIYYFAFFYLEDQALIVYHDQLDAEILSYILNAKHLGEDFIPELFCGTVNTALTPAAPVMVLVYKIFPPFTAYMLCYLFVIVISYVGMFLCTKEIFHVEWLSCIVAVLFTMLPFYPVYGMTVMGQPMLLYAAILIYKDFRIKRSWFLIVLFTISSSLVLAGYVDIILLSLAVVILFVLKKKQYKAILIMDLLMIVIYSLLNTKLITEIIFGKGGFVSHKTEVLPTGVPFTETFWSMLKDGAYHAGSVHRMVYYYSIVAVIVVFLFYRKLEKKSKNLFKFMLALVIYCVFAAGFYALWSWYPVAELRYRLGGLFVSFQADRFYWLYPCIWYLIFGFILWFIHDLCKKGTPAKAVGVLLTACLTINLFVSIDSQNNESVNNQKLVGINSSRQASYTTWKEFYSENLFVDIKEYIGMDQSEYRAGSIGLYPSIALYNGFYCIDGYSSNYDVEYKHEFRKIIEKELDKNESLKNYFDNWGSRCYLFVAEIPFSYYPSKENENIIRNLELKGDELKKLGCEYIFSGYYIENPENSGLKFCKKFEDKNAPYDIYLYQVI